MELAAVDAVQIAEIAVIRRSQRGRAHRDRTAVRDREGRRHVGARRAGRRVEGDRRPEVVGDPPLARGCLRRARPGEPGRQGPGGNGRASEL